MIEAILVVALVHCFALAWLCVVLQRRLNRAFIPRILERKDFPDGTLFIKPVVVLTGPGEFVVLDANTNQRFAFEGIVAQQMGVMVNQETGRWRLNIVLDQVEVFQAAPEISDTAVVGAS